jgi:hypothetical protein
MQSKQLIFFVIGISLFFLSCKKDTTLVAGKTQPPEDVLTAGVTNVLQIHAYTKKYESIACYNSRFKFLGCNNDPYLGYMNVGLCMNANLNSSNWNFGTGNKVNSCEIILVVNSVDFAGDKTALNTYSVYTLDSTLSNSRVYLNNNDNLFNPNGLIGHSTITFSSLLNGKLVLRIPVDTGFAGKILRDTLALKDNDAFLAKYKGFYVKTGTNTNNQGTIYKCDMEDDDSGFFISYKDKKDSLEYFRFSFTGNAAVKFNTVSYNFTNAHPNLKSQLSGDTAAGAANLFLKGMGATKLRLYMPTLKNLTDSFNVAVNRAEVSLYVDFQNFPGQGKIDEGGVTDNVRYNIPLQLSLIAADSTGKENYVIDQMTSIDAARYDGNYDKDNKRYVFNIARHVQAILSGKKKNYGFYVVVANPDFRFTILRDNCIDRVVLAGTTNNTLKPTLLLNYVKMKNP